MKTPERKELGALGTAAEPSDAAAVDSVAILDCGGQYTKVIDRKVRELRVRSDIFPINVAPDKLRGYGGIILSGGPSSVWEESHVSCDRALFELGKPMLGICYGMQLINQYLGGTVEPGQEAEFGETEIEVDASCPLFADTPKRQVVLMSHGDAVRNLAPNFDVCGRSPRSIAAIWNAKQRIYGVQFHPEVDLTTHGRQMLRNFLERICGFVGNYTLEDRIDASVNAIRKQVGDGRVVVLVSGGVDSAVTAALVLRALGPERVIAIHVDHGLMRKDESRKITDNLKRLGFAQLIVENAAATFFTDTVETPEGTLGPLSKLTDPEGKRRLVGDLFIHTVDRVTKRLNIDLHDVYLAQGTLRPDLIESGNPDVSGFARKIKTHHNDVPWIREARTRGRVVETNADWHKDEVREVGRRLGLEESIVNRQPFPGPGLTVRILAASDAASIAPTAHEELEARLQQVAGEIGIGNAVRERHISAAIAPILSVGVQGDYRSYRHLCTLATHSPRPDWQTIYAYGSLVPNGLNFVNRVAWAINARELVAPLNFAPLYVTPQSADLLRELDAIVTGELERSGAAKQLSQYFAVLLPFARTKARSVAIRAFITDDFMTGRPARLGSEIGWETLETIATRITATTPEIDLVLYDVTSKPPATVEWQ